MMLQPEFRRSFYALFRPPLRPFSSLILYALFVQVSDRFFSLILIPFFVHLLGPFSLIFYARSRSIFRPFCQSFLCPCRPRFVVLLSLILYDLFGPHFIPFSSFLSPFSFTFKPFFTHLLGPFFSLIFRALFAQVSGLVSLILYAFLRPHFIPFSSSF